MSAEYRQRTRVLDLIFGTLLVMMAGFLGVLSTGILALTDGYLSMAIVMIVWVPPFGLGLCMLHAGLRKR